MKWLKEVLKDKDGKYSINRPFYLLFIVLFIFWYFYLTARKSSFPEIPWSTFLFLSFLYGYEVFKKVLLWKNGGSNGK